MSKLIQYRVRPVTRYIVTRYTQEPIATVDGLPVGKGSYSAGCYELGEFDRQELAINLAALLTKTEDGAVMLDSFGDASDASWVDEILARWKR